MPTFEVTRQTTLKQYLNVPVILCRKQVSREMAKVITPWKFYWFYNPMAENDENVHKLMIFEKKETEALCI